ncbi:MAG: hypothetical protein Q7J25_11650 [Vicinamibacterales bacterium]|nr:hypothetical protein [Vicinamibacterales bacterium]
MASEPEIDDVVAARVPVPENEHPGVTTSTLLLAVRVKVADVSCDPETVPLSVVLATCATPASF